MYNYSKGTEHNSKYGGSKTKSTFTIFDIKNLIKSYDNATIKHDCLPKFLNSYDFEAVYTIDDNSIVFDAGDEHKISIEFFNFESALAREMNVMYWEKGKPVILNY